MRKEMVVLRHSTKDMVLTGMGIALVFVATLFINLRLPIGQGGLIHLGNVPLFLFAILFGKKTGAIAGAFGMGLFDLMGGWTPWAPATFMIVGLMGYTVGLVAERNDSTAGYVLAVVLACVIKVAGYYVAEALIYGNWVQPVLSIPGNLMQIGVAALIVLPMAGTLK
ncbi:MAG: ECF transporter S component, partial [Peptococcaceae bacterium]|nr:ECF transporter S component [Peptococcaceae bacterium]